MSGKSDVSEVVHVFIPGMHQKLDELNEVLDVLLEEGPNPSAIEVVYRASFSLKSLATAFDQQEMVDFIAREFDTLLNRVRIRAEKPSPGVKASFRSFVEKLRALVDGLSPNEPIVREAASVTVSRREDSLQTLAAIGQLSIWSFHDITNYLAKMQGYAEMLEDCRDTLTNAKSHDEIQNELAELATIQTKVAENVGAITASIARIRMARGKVQAKTSHLELKPLITDLMRATLFSKYNVSWSAGMLPNVKVEQDRIVFELVWVYMWRLLAEWFSPDIAARAMCETRIQVNHREDPSQNLPDRLLLHFWLEPRAQETAPILLEKIHFSRETPLVDLGGVFQVVSQAVLSRGLNVQVGTTPTGHPIFRLTMPCGISEQAELVSPEWNKAPQASDASDTAKTPARPYVLVVDDERDLRSLLTVKITKMGYPVIAVESIAEARSTLQKENVTVVLADLFLSQESGLDLLREVRATWPDVAFIFMSGANEDDVPAAILKVLSMYANAFLRKPIPTATLKTTIDKFYDKKPGAS